MTIKNKKIKLACFLVFTVVLNILGFSQHVNKIDSNVEIKILSWNIYMLPHFIIKTGQTERAREIVDHLKNEQVDVIVFQEAFDKNARNIIREGLREQFPYDSGNPLKNKFYKINSGVWVLSKAPIFFVKNIYFKNSKGNDRLACKGAVMLSSKKDSCYFQIIATHLQSDLKSKDVTEIRKSQYLQIKEELLDLHGLNNVPQFIVGDMNTINSDTLAYNQMTKILNVENSELVGEQNFTYDTKKNDILSHSNEKPQLIDYIFFNRKDKASLLGKINIKVFRKKWNLINMDLSDHFAVLGSFVLKNY